MDKKLEKLVQKYSNYLSNGISIIKELDLKGRKDTCTYIKQREINYIWTMFLKDLKDLTDKQSDANNRKKRPKLGPSTDK